MSPRGKAKNLVINTMLNYTLRPARFLRFAAKNLINVLKIDFSGQTSLDGNCKD